MSLHLPLREYALQWRREAIRRWNWMIGVYLVMLVVSTLNAIDAPRAGRWFFGVIAVIVAVFACFIVWWRGQLVEHVAKLERGEDIWS